MGHGKNTREVIDRESWFMANQGQRGWRTASMSHLPFGGVLDLIGEAEREQERSTRTGSVLERDKGKALAAQCTLNRLELSAEAIDARYHKIQAQPVKIEELLIKRGVKAIPGKSAEIVLDFDATDDRLPWQPARRLFSRLLSPLLLPAALLLLRKHSALGPIARLQGECQRWHG